MIYDSISDYGAGRSILVDRAGTVIAGNKTLEQARELGLDIETIQSDGTKLVVVQRTDVEIDTPIGRGLAYTDNRAAEIDLAWDAEQIAADRDRGLLPADAFAEWELTAIAERDAENGAGGSGGTPPSEFPEYGENIATDFECPKCGYEWSGKTSG